MVMNSALMVKLRMLCTARRGTLLRKVSILCGEMLEDGLADCTKKNPSRALLHATM